MLCQFQQHVAASERCEHMRSVTGASTSCLRILHNLADPALSAQPAGHILDQHDTVTPSRTAVIFLLVR